MAGSRSFRVHQAAGVRLPPESRRRADQDTQHDMLQLATEAKERGKGEQLQRVSTLSGN